MTGAEVALSILDSETDCKPPLVTGKSGVEISQVFPAKGFEHDAELLAGSIEPCQTTPLFRSVASVENGAGAGNGKSGLSPLTAKDPFGDSPRGSQKTEPRRVESLGQKGAGPDEKHYTGRGHGSRIGIKDAFGRGAAEIARINASGPILLCDIKEKMPAVGQEGRVARKQLAWRYLHHFASAGRNPLHRPT